MKTQPPPQKPRQRGLKHISAILKNALEDIQATYEEDPKTPKKKEGA